MYRTPEKSKITINETEVDESDYDFSLAAIKSRVEKMTSAQEHGALHHQCIDELSSHFTSGGGQVANGADNSKSNVVPASPTPSVTPSSFVTVIEVKESSPMMSMDAMASMVTEEQPVAEESPAKVATGDLNRSSRSDDSFTSNVHLDVKRKVPPRSVISSRFYFVVFSVLLYFAEFSLNVLTKLTGVLFVV